MRTKTALVLLVPVLLAGPALVSRHHEAVHLPTCNGDGVPELTGTPGVVVSDETADISPQGCVRRIALEPTGWSSALARDLVDRFAAEGWTMNREGAFRMRGVLIEDGVRRELSLERTPLAVDDDGGELPQSVTLEISAASDTATDDSGEFVATGPPRYYQDVVIVPGDDSIVGVDESGAVRWETPCRSSAWWSPVATPATEYVPVRCDAEIVGLRVTDGEAVWRRPLFDSGHRRVGEDVLAATTGGRILAIDLGTGEDRWSVPVHSQVNLAVDADSVYAASNLHTTAYDVADGSVQWDEPWSAVAALAADGDLYLRSSGVLRLDPGDGEQIWLGSLDYDRRLRGSDFYGVTNDVVIAVSAGDRRGEGAGLVTALRRDDGALAWTFDGTQSGAEISTGDRYVVINEPVVLRATVVDGQTGVVQRTIDDTLGCTLAPDDESVACINAHRRGIGLSVSPME